MVRNINSTKPARFNSDPKLLYGASGSAGKVAVFAVRLKTYPSAKRNQVFYVGANHPDTFWKIRKDVLQNFIFQKQIELNTSITFDFIHEDLESHLTVILSNKDERWTKKYFLKIIKIQIVF